MSQQTLSTEAGAPAAAGSAGLALGAVLRRALLQAGAISLAIVGVAAGPALVRNWRPLLARLARPAHLPDLAALARAPLPVKLHLATLLVAIACTVVLLAGVKGSRLHRTLGWTWAAAMLTTAVATLFIPAPAGAPNLFHLGYLHLFALLTFISVPRVVMAARAHDVRRHASVVAGFLVGGLGLAGLFAFLPGRLMWQVMFG